MQLTVELIGERIKFCQEYEKENLGLKNGPDFPEVARLLMACKEFEGVAMMTSVMGMMPMLGKRPENPDEKEDFMRALKSSTKEPLAMMFYIGYRLGKAEAETADLERLAG
jgi:hypothetical protein